MTYKNTKVVAWLTNKPIEEEKYEREQFFKKINVEIQRQFTAAMEMQMQNNPFYIQQSKLHGPDDGVTNDVSMMS